MPNSRSSSRASSSLRVLVTKVISIPWLKFSLSGSISGKMACSETPDRIVAVAVEALGVHTAEVANSRQGDVDQSIQEFVHPLAPQGDAAADFVTFAEAEGADGLF